MSGWGLRGGLALALLAAGCAPPQRTCLSVAARCNSLVGICEQPPAACAEVPVGANQALVEILSNPTTAEIYVEGKSIGRTPITYPLWYNSQTRFIRVSAEPLYPGQARQEHRLRAPPLPARIQFFMNNPAQSDAESQQEH
ncbi:MAG: PEGA domain-containing protein [Chromatiaceae bacterium]